MIRFGSLILTCAVLSLQSLSSFAGETITFQSQHRVLEDGIIRVEQQTTEWDAEKTAIIVCDMWDKHWCSGATARVAEMAPTMEKVLQAARAMGVLIIHAPSSTMGFYADTPQRKKAQQAKESVMPSQDGWRHLQESEGPLPIDDSDGGCDDFPACDIKAKSPWTRQIETLSIGEHDAISDDGQEVYNLLQAEGRDNVIVMGVHTNMCVLGRPFSIRANVSNGKNVVLMKDLTDSMYNSRSEPFVNHFRGTELVSEHIETHWAPTITSSVFTGAAPFRFAGDDRPHAVFLIHEKEYDTRRTVPAFAEAAFAEERGWKCTYLMGDELHSLPGTKIIDDADLLFVSMRRQALPADQLNAIKAYVTSGKPVVGIRTASHAFTIRGEKPATGFEWTEFDRDVLGGNYHDHYNNKAPDTPRSYIWSAEEAAAHPVMEGVTAAKRITTSWLYKVLPLADTTTPFMWGQFEENTPEPVAWTNTSIYGGNVFYTSLGHPDDFESEDFRRMLTNGMLWALGEMVETSRTAQTTDEE